jgi:hypothetical protein
MFFGTQKLALDYSSVVDQYSARIRLDRMMERLMDRLVQVCDRIDDKYYEVARPGSLAERLAILARNRIYEDFLTTLPS